MDALTLALNVNEPRSQKSQIFFSNFWGKKLAMK